MSETLKIAYNDDITICVGRVVTTYAFKDVQLWFEATDPVLNELLKDHGAQLAFSLNDSDDCCQYTVLGYGIDSVEDVLDNLCEGCG